jgi:hypothetical protein
VASHESKPFLPISLSEVFDARAFDNTAAWLRRNDSSPSSLDPSRPQLTIQAQTERTSPASILLEGPPEKGITVVPTFRRWNVNAGEIKPPPEVNVDFASFSEKQNLQTLPRLLITIGR